VVDKIRPDGCYHLAAQSFVSYSFEDEFSMINVNINDIMKTYPQKIIINRSCLKKGGRYGWSRPNQKD
jgi:hypothetical protein